MIPYDPLIINNEETTISDPMNDEILPPDHESQPDTMSFETMSLRMKLTGLLLLFPLYLFVLRKILQVFLPSIPVTDAAGQNFQVLLFNVVHDLIMLFLLLILFRRFLAQSFRKLRLLGIGQVLARIGVSYTAFYLFNLAGSYLTVILTGPQISLNQQALQQVTKFYPVPMFFLAVLIGPIVEELLFRGILYRTIRPLGAIPATLLSGTLFGFLHVMQFVFAGNLQEIVMAIPYIGIGIALTLIYEKNKNILFNISIHMLHNCLSYFLILLLRSAGLF